MCVNLIAPHNSPTDTKPRKTEESKDGSYLPQVVESGLELRFSDFGTLTHWTTLPLQHIHALKSPQGSKEEGS